MNNNEFSQVDTRQATSREEIARRAEELWQRNGCPEGRDDEFWFEAERQLSGTAVSAAEEAREPAAPETSPLSSLGGQELGAAIPPQTVEAEALPSARDTELMKTGRSKGSPGRGRGRKAGGK